MPKVHTFMLTGSPTAVQDAILKLSKEKGVRLSVVQRTDRIDRENDRSKVIGSASVIGFTSREKLTHVLYVHVTLPGNAKKAKAETARILSKCRNLRPFVPFKDEKAARRTNETADGRTEAARTKAKALASGKSVAKPKALKIAKAA